MRKASDTTLRYLAILQLIPVHPKGVSAAQIQQQLRAGNTELDVGIRTIQRDLEKLSGQDAFPLTCEQRGRTNHWCWRDDRHAFIQIPAMSKTVALACRLASEHLQPLMPPATLRLLAPYFNHADKILQQTKLGRWPAKVRIIGRGPELIAPTVTRKVQEVVYEALLEDKQFEADYRRKGQAVAKHQVLNPLGIVLRGVTIYLVATTWDYNDPRHYALHRMSNASLSDKRAKSIAGFDLARHVEEEKEFSYPVSAKKIKLRALFSDDAAIHLTESKLSEDQKIINKKQDRMLVEATVADTAELRWWLLGFGSSVKVLGPGALKKEFSELTEEMSNLYKQ